MSFLWSYFQEIAPVYSSILVEYLNEIRTGFNRLFMDLEPWQIVAYTLSVTFFIMWTRQLLKADRPLWIRVKARAFRIIRRLPWIRSRIAHELAKIQLDLEETIHKHDRRREFYKFLPEKGLLPDEILGEAELYQMMGDFAYRNGKVSGTVYTDEAHQHMDVLNKIFEMYAYSNPLHPDVFPGCRKMEAEVVRIICNLFHGGLKSCGTVRIFQPDSDFPVSRFHVTN